MNPNTLRPTVNTATRTAGRISGAGPSYCAMTIPAYITALRMLTIRPPRHDCTVLAAMIGSV